MHNQTLIDELLHAALEVGQSPQLVCVDHPELLEIVQERWEQCRKLADKIDLLFPDVAELSAVHWQDSDSELPEIPGYLVERILGRGGMGIVYLAHHLQLDRPVAIKMMLSGMYASQLERSRFAHESQVVARLRHEHTVQIYDVGESQGCPYFTMEYIEGGTLSQKLAGAPQAVQSTAHVMIALARGTDRAHQCGIIHRDLKPANVLLTADGTPKISDFGLARRFGVSSEMTFSGSRLGTPCYMSPEQAAGHNADIGPATDVYSLGAILYEMLTGRPPFQGETPLDTERQVLFDEPIPPARLNSRVPRDLQTICLKCLEKRPSSRYANAAEIADDLERFLRDEPITAAPISIIERIKRWAVRNRSQAAMLSGLIVAVVLMIAGSLTAAGYYHHFADKMQVLAGEKGRLAIEKEVDRQKAILGALREIELRKQSEQLSRELSRNLYLSEMVLASQASTIPSGLGKVRELITPWAHHEPDFRGWEWHFLNQLCHRDLRTFDAHSGGTFEAVWSPLGDRFASGGSDGRVRIWDLNDAGKSLDLTGHTQVVSSVAWSPDGKRLVSGGRDSMVRVWDAVSGNELHLLSGHTDDVLTVAWHPRQNLIASGGSDQSIRIWDITTGNCLVDYQGHDGDVASLAWHPSGNELASGGRDAAIHIWNALEKKKLHSLSGHSNWIQEVAWNQEGTRLASASNDQLAIIWDPVEEKPLQQFGGHWQGVTAVAWSPDGARLATASDDLTLNVWSANDGAVLSTLRGHTASLTSIDWSPNGRQLLTAAFDGTVRLWDAETFHESRIAGTYPAPVTSIGTSPHVKHLIAIRYLDGTVQIFDTDLHKEFATLEHVDDATVCMAFHPRRNQILTVSRAGRIRLWNDGSVVPVSDIDCHVENSYAVAWRPDGTEIAIVGADGVIRIWPESLQGEPRKFEPQNNPLWAVSWSPDGQRLLTGSQDSLVRIWDANTGTEQLTYREHTSSVQTAEWSPDGKTIASAGFDHTVRFWDSETGVTTRKVGRHSSQVNQVAWHPDGSRLASVSHDGSIVLWDIQTGREALVFSNSSSRLNCVAWNVDGTKLFTGSEGAFVNYYQISNPKDEDSQSK